MQLGTGASCVGSTCLHPIPSGQAHCCEIRTSKHATFGASPLGASRATWRPARQPWQQPSGWRRRDGVAGCESGKEATKGVWWMPRHQEATKDVANCDMRRRAVRERSSRRFPNGATRWPNKPSLPQREHGEVKHLSNRRSRNQPRFPK